MPFKKDPSSVEELRKTVAKAQKGDRTALTELVGQTEKKLFRFCLFLTGTVTGAEDLCQEAYVKAFAHLSSLKKSEAFGAWLFRMARNLFLDRAKSAWLTKVTLVEDGDRGGDGSDEAQRMVKVLEVRRVLAQLKPEERLTLLLVDQQGFSYRETGDILGISEAAVTSRVHRARKAFVSIYGEGEERNMEGQSSVQVEGIKEP